MSSGQQHRSDEAVVAEEQAADLVRDEYEHPEATKWFKALPCLRGIPLFGDVTAAFGPRFALSLGFCYTFSKGASSSIIRLSRQPMFVGRYGVDAVRFQRLSSMYAFGWSLKPFIAALTDVIALLGYTKRWYMAVSALFGTAFALAYALLPAKKSSANPAGAFIFLTCLCKANIDVLSEGHFSRSMKQKPKVGPAVVSWVWAMTFIGTVISAAMMGPLSDVKLTYVGVIVSAGLQFICFFFFMFNMYDEKKNRTNRRKDALVLYQARKHLEREPVGKTVQDQVVDGAGEPAVYEDGTNGCLVTGEASLDRDDDSDDEFVEPHINSCLHGIFEVNVDVAKTNWKLIVYSVVMTCGIIAMVCVTLFGTKWQLMYACIVVAAVFIAGAFLTLPLVIAKASVFIYFDSILYLHIPGALSNFYVAAPACLPDGPHFNYLFYQTVGSLISDFGGVLGAILFNKFFSRHGYVFVFIATTILRVLGSIFDLIIVKRWNMYIGIPDHAMYLLGDSIVYQVCFVMSLMPAQILMARLCPRGTEAIAFSLLAGFSSAGTSMSLTIGSLIMEGIWPVSAKSPCNFKNVPWLIITGHLVMPLLVVPLAFVLLPRARICDRVDFDGNVIREEADVFDERTAPSEHIAANAPSAAQHEAQKKDTHDDEENPSKVW
ncbi:putative pteridine transporter [Leptomonas pyrrhocoris]|uniref:Putative pteridine transporter n=1 Tax=Leptomonas pyrrhocoris TaxID=157538 RepID=A0A0N0DWL4_LEPPY|nr:putative pteridine transporter [Leptomonas pyrrhocoris]XP_015660371.1 putative pteridine transporter [Leptomonas pyrrhocoris]KPA81931.1 putative pteridine transporter [Leptomonas pyrrhocoris]KPA81932.1 putative pteridine transporter [Leptomonas pyrrhocoris]|eukprot:XP_015660370.1 putative pteridine transporter [Leptomonas pyrrhocoris]